MSTAAGRGRTLKGEPWRPRQMSQLKAELLTIVPALVPRRLYVRLHLDLVKRARLTDLPGRGERPKCYPRCCGRAADGHPRLTAEHGGPQAPATGKYSSSRAHFTCRRAISLCAMQSSEAVHRFWKNPNVWFRAPPVSLSRRLGRPGPREGETSWAIQRPGCGIPSRHDECLSDIHLTLAQRTAGTLTNTQHTPRWATILYPHSTTTSSASSSR